jgi:uncharacterized protein (TIGR00297 family)
MFPRGAPMSGRLTAGLLVAAAIALAARRAGSLSGSGAVAATAVGVACVAAGWGWAALLIVYFLVAVLVSRAGAAEKTRRTGSIVAKGGRRDAAQVLSNGGLFALLALGATAADPPRSIALAAAALGALAASAADTFATEIGTLLGGTPRSLRTWRAVPPGTSGGVSAAGTLAMIAGAALVAVAARGLSLGGGLAAVTIGGIAGALADSLVGATQQERRWCPRCNRATERRQHDCGAATELVGGLRWLDNDAVNLVATVVGAAVAAALAGV